MTTLPPTYISLTPLTFSWNLSCKHIAVARFIKSCLCLGSYFSYVICCVCFFGLNFSPCQIIEYLNDNYEYAFPLPFTSHIIGWWFHDFVIDGVMLFVCSHHVAAPRTGVPQLHQEGILGKKHGATKSVVVRMFRVVVQCVEDLKLSGWLWFEGRFVLISLLLYLCYDYWKTWQAYVWNFHVDYA